MRKTAFILLFAVLLTANVRAEGNVPSVSAAAWAVCDVTSGRILAGGNADQVLPMASTTKIMTALIACEEYRADTEITITPECYAEGSSMYLRDGETVSVEELVYGLMLMSGNDAARALALNYEGGYDAFVARMNERADELGLEDTSFVTPNGLDADGHHTTARELARLAAYALSNETFRKVVSTTRATVAGRSMYNHNKLLTFCDDCTGVKTGYTKKAGRCLVSSFSDGTSEIVIVTLNAPDDWRDHMKLRDWAFENYAARTLIGDGETAVTIGVMGGDTAQMTAVAEAKVEVLLSEQEAARVNCEILAPHFTYAPVRAGDPCGELVYSLDGTEIARVRLVWGGDAEQSEPRKLSLFEKVKEGIAAIAEGLGF